MPLRSRYLCGDRDEADPESAVPLNLADDLWKLWIEKTYFPQERAVASEVSDEARVALETFTEFFRARLPLFPRRFESLMTDVHWLSVIEYAKVLLDQLARDDKPSDDDG